MRVRKILFGGLIVLIVVLVAWGIGKIVARSKRPSAPVSPVIAPFDQQLKLERQTLNQRVQELKQTDRDLDGLSDAEEKKIGTDPNKADTDNDGLLDADEVQNYKTDPIKFDTYGIGHSDAWGVQHRVILFGGKVDSAELKKYTK